MTIPLTYHHFIGYVALLVANILSSAAGIGGGSINVSILLALGHFSYETSIILSFFTLLGNLLFQVAINLSKSHPLISTRPLIYWEIVLIFLPGQLGGSSIGVVLQRILPESMLLLLTLIVLGFAFAFTMNRFVSLYSMESLDIDFSNRMRADHVTRSELSESDSQMTENYFDEFDSLIDVIDLDGNIPTRSLANKILDAERIRTIERIRKDYKFPW